MTLLRMSLVACALALACKETFNHAQERRAQIEQLIPIGSSRATVEATIDRHGTSLELARGPYDSVSHSIRALARNTSRSFLIRGDLKIVFVFDSSGRLVHEQMKEVFTGP
jgi:hypothetical protein